MEWYEIAAILFAQLMFFLFIGVPVAFSLGMSAAISTYLFLDVRNLVQLGRIAFETSSTHLFIVAPLFILMAGLVSRSDVARQGFVAATKWLTWLPGSLPAATVISATAFAAVSGSSPATAAAIGQAAVPEMLRHGYSPRISVGAVAAGGTLGILIPPSIVLIIYGIITETSIGSLFMAGLIPGLMMSGLLVGYVVLSAVLNPGSMPRHDPVPMAEKLESMRGIWPILVLFMVVMGTIYTGIATPTEAAALGAAAALVLTVGRRGMGLRGLNVVALQTAQTTAMIIFLIIGGTFFGYVVAATGIAHGMVQAVLDADVAPWTVLLLYILALLILGCLIDPASLMVITLPLAFPVLSQLGFDPVWLGVLVTVAVEVGLITPPVGINLFVLKSVVPEEVSMVDIAMGALPFVGVLLFGLVLLLLFPPIATWLPTMLS